MFKLMKRSHLRSSSYNKLCYFSLQELRELAIKNKDIYPTSHGKLHYNIKKNRYKDIVPCKYIIDLYIHFQGSHGHDHIVGFTTTYGISAYHH